MWGVLGNVFKLYSMNSLAGQGISILTLLEHLATVELRISDHQP